MVNYATIGTSAITEKFISACALTEKYKLSAVYSRDIKRGQQFACAHGCRTVYNDLSELAGDSTINAVYIASPNVFHESQSRLFLENGKHVICEKPIAVSAKGYKKLYDLAEKNNLIYLEAMMSRHSQKRQDIKNALLEIGNIAHARIDYCQLTSRYEALLKDEHINIFDMSLAAGTLMDLGIYCVYATVDLLGVPIDITASAAFLENGADKSGSAIFNYNNFQAVLSYSKIGQSAIGSEIIGDKGTIKIGSVSQYNHVTLIKNGIEKAIVSSSEHNVVMSGEAYRFADYLEKSEVFLEDYRQASSLCLEVHKCMDKIKESAGIRYNLII